MRRLLGMIAIVAALTSALALPGTALADNHDGDLAFDCHISASGSIDRPGQGPKEFNVEADFPSAIDLTNSFSGEFQAGPVTLTYSVDITCQPVPGP